MQYSLPSKNKPFLPDTCACTCTCLVCRELNWISVRFSDTQGSFVSRPLPPGDLWAEPPHPGAFHPWAPTPRGCRYPHPVTTGPTPRGNHSFTQRQPEEKKTEREGKEWCKREEDGQNMANKIFMPTAKGNTLRTRYTKVEKEKEGGCKEKNEVSEWDR